MPYKNEYADKSSHFDIVKNPEVKQFISECSYMVPPSENEQAYLKQLFVPAKKDYTDLPENIIAVDGSNYEASINKNIPSTKIGYVKIGNLLIQRGKFNNLREAGSDLVDPFLVAKLQDDNLGITFTLPSSNVIYKEQDNVKDSFRLALDKHLFDYRSIKDNYKTSLRSTLFLLGQLRRNDKNSEVIYLHKCPGCGEKKIPLKDVEEKQKCPHCEGPVFISDSLRIWEEISNFMPNGVALTRVMNVVEHLLPIHYIRVQREYNKDSYLDVLSNLAFFIDGPLAIFGNPAWVHSSIMKYLYETNQILKENQKNEVFIIGLQKTGYVPEYFKLISECIDNNTIYAIEDSVRYKYIIPNRTFSSSTFGSETYYGQDFMFKTNTGRIFVFGLPYPFFNKDNMDNFTIEKAKINNYTRLGQALALLEEFECDLYENSVIPIALAHKYTAISMRPGSKVLDLLSRTSMED